MVFQKCRATITGQSDFLKFGKSETPSDCLQEETDICRVALNYDKLLYFTAQSTITVGLTVLILLLVLY